MNGISRVWAGLILFWFSTVTVASEPIRVMSFNLRGDFDYGVAVESPNGWNSSTGDHRRERALLAIKTYQPDLLGVQEALPNQTAELRAALNSYGFYGVGRDDGESAGEQSSLYYRTDRFSLAKNGSFWMSETPDQPSNHPKATCPRIASWVVLRDKASDDRELLVLNTHWEHAPAGAEAREFSAALLLRRLANLTGTKPLIVMGDFNAFESDRSMQLLLGSKEGQASRLVDSYRAVHPEVGSNEKTYHGFKGGIAGKRIDYVLHNSALRATEAAIVQEPVSDRYASDHYPVTATLVYVQ